jgi:hypothetical protein
MTSSCLTTNTTAAKWGIEIRSSEIAGAVMRFALTRETLGNSENKSKEP